MIPWDTISHDEWHPYADQLRSKPGLCPRCDWPVQENGWYGGGNGNDPTTKSINAFCEPCDLSLSYRALEMSGAHAATMGLACPKIVPRAYGGLWVHDQRPVVGTFMTALLWLDTVIYYVTIRGNYLEAFALYGLFFETILASHWGMRNQKEPKKTLGNLVQASRKAGYITEGDALTLMEYVELRNDLIHGRWRNWSKADELLPRLSQRMDVDGRLWAWFFHERGYTRTTLALYSGLPEPPAQGIKRAESSP